MTSYVSSSIRTKLHLPHTLPSFIPSHARGPGRSLKNAVRSNEHTRYLFSGVLFSWIEAPSRSEVSRGICQDHRPLTYKLGTRPSVGCLTVMDRNPFFDTFQDKGTAPRRHATHEAGLPMSTPDGRPPLPPYHLEQVRIPVGGKVPKDSLVTTSQLKTHLGLLKAFRELKDRVTDLEANQDVRNKLPSMAQELGPQ